MIVKNLIAALLAFASLSSCQGPKIVTLNQYNDVYVSEKVEDLEYHLGRPYKMRDLSGGVKEYVYIERIPVMAHKDLFRTYTITVQNGKVVSKKMEEAQASPVEFHSN
jgi:hypothetical protein